MKQVLDRIQMAELEALGVDTSDASCIWHSYTDANYNPISWMPIFRGEEMLSIEEMRKAFPHTYKEGNLCYAYTLQDILKILPKPCYINCIDEDFYQCEVTTEEGSSSTSGKTAITAAFNMLKHCKQNKLI